MACINYIVSSLVTRLRRRFPNLVYEGPGFGGEGAVWFETQVFAELYEKCVLRAADLRR